MVKYPTSSEADVTSRNLVTGETLSKLDFLTNAKTLRNDSSRKPPKLPADGMHTQESIRVHPLGIIIETIAAPIYPKHCHENQNSSESRRSPLQH